MKKLLALAAAALALVGALPDVAVAQLSNANVVAACGTPNTTYPVNGSRAITQDTNGKVCTSGTGGGGGSGAVYGPTAEGSANANPPVMVGGTTDGSGTGTVSMLKVDASGNAAVTTSNLFSLEATQQQVKTDLDALAASLNAPIPAGTAIIGKFGIDQTTPGTTNAVQPIAGSTGGASSYGLQSAATTNSTNVKASAGVLYGMNLLNTTTTVYYLRMYDAAAAPTCSSATNFVRAWPVPPAQAAGQVGGIAVNLPSTGTQFATGISFCLTAGPTSTDNTAAATGVFINLDYK